MDLSLAEVARLIAAANAARWPMGGPADPAGADAERQLDALFRTNETLVVYGTLAPGKPNHHVVAPLGGQWMQGVIEGDLVPVGWGATYGYPAFWPREGGAEVPVHVLTAAALVRDWPRLDRFEGPGYRRILVPVFHPGPAADRRLYTVGNLYAAADAGPGASG